MKYGGQNEFSAIRRLLLKHPKEAFLSQVNIDKQWSQLNYPSAPELTKALDEYEHFVELISLAGPEVNYLPVAEATTIDSIYTRDALLSTDQGVILCSMGKAERRAEPSVSSEFLLKQDIPVLGEIKGEGRLEGGDLIFLDDQTIVVGRGYRTNDEGIRQLRELTKHFVETILTVPLPHWQGPTDVFHLMSFISPLAKDLAAVYSPLLPVPFREFLIKRGITLVEVPEPEFKTMGCNILAIEPRRALMLTDNPVTKKRLQAAGVDVITYDGYEISRKGEGGPTCLTRPILRG